MCLTHERQTGVMPPARRIVVGHGSVISNDPKAQLSRAYDWLG